VKDLNFSGAEAPITTAKELLSTVETLYRNNSSILFDAVAQKEKEDAARAKAVPHEDYMNYPINLSLIQLFMEDAKTGKAYEVAVVGSRDTEDSDLTVRISLNGLFDKGFAKEKWKQIHIREALAFYVLDLMNKGGNIEQITAEIAIQGLKTAKNYSEFHAKAFERSKIRPYKRSDIRGKDQKELRFLLQGKGTILFEEFMRAAQVGLTLDVHSEAAGYVIRFNPAHLLLESITILFQKETIKALKKVDSSVLAVIGYESAFGFIHELGHIVKRHLESYGALNAHQASEAALERHIRRTF
jgi:hypothetical protein